MVREGVSGVIFVRVELEFDFCMESYRDICLGIYVFGCFFFIFSIFIFFVFVVGRF